MPSKRIAAQPWLIAAYVFCLLVTLGPLGFIIAADPIQPG